MIEIAEAGMGISSERNALIAQLMLSEAAGIFQGLL